MKAVAAFARKNITSQSALISAARCKQLQCTKKGKYNNMNITIYLNINIKYKYVIFIFYIYTDLLYETQTQASIMNHMYIQWGERISQGANKP